jgi:hypothetical protein
MPQSHNDDQKNAIVNRVHDAVAANTNLQPGSPLKRLRSWWPRILTKQSNRTTNPIPVLMIYSL